INDQGLYNVYCRQYPEKCTILDQKNGLIFTGGAIKFDKVKLNNQNKIINQDNVIYTIVHQLNRWKQEDIDLLKNS